MPTKTSLTPASPARTNVLLVDDEPHNLVALEENEAALVIMDVMMPVLDAFETATLIRQRMEIKKGLCILMADDEPQVLTVAARMLRIDGHQVVQAANGQEGLASFQAGCFDLVITDLSMPGMSGVQFAGLVKKLAPDQPVILLTGMADCLEQTPDVIDLVLSKPVTPENLQRAIDEVMKMHKKA